jgi:hypothetical protein
MSAELVEKETFDLLPERNQFDWKKKLGEIVASAQSVEVNNENAFRKITSMYAQSKDWERMIEFSRKQANAPDQERINARNDKAKEILIPLKQIQSIAKDKSARYQEMLEEIKRDEEDQIKKAVALLDLENEPYIEPAEKTHRGDGAIAYTKLVKKFRLVDLSKVPLKYLTLDESAVEQDIKLGVMEISGIEVFEEKITTLRTR